jgi:hypothetical protein
MKYLLSLLSIFIFSYTHPALSDTFKFEPATPPQAVYKCYPDETLEVFKEIDNPNTKEKATCSDLLNFESSPENKKNSPYTFVWEKKTSKDNATWLLIYKKDGSPFWVKELTQKDDHDPSIGIRDFLMLSQNKQISFAPSWDHRVYGKPNGKKSEIVPLKRGSVVGSRIIDGQIWLFMKFYTKTELVEGPSPKRDDDRPTEGPMVTKHLNICTGLETNYQLRGWIPLISPKGFLTVRLAPCF